MGPWAVQGEYSSDEGDPKVARRENVMSPDRGRSAVKQETRSADATQLRARVPPICAGVSKREPRHSRQ